MPTDARGAMASFLRPLSFSRRSKKDGAGAEASSQPAPSPFQCPLCFEEEVAETTFTPCAHRFCTACLSKWAQTAQTCPTCRTPLGAGLLTLLLTPVGAAPPPPTPKPRAPAPAPAAAADNIEAARAAAEVSLVHNRGTAIDQAAQRAIARMEGRDPYAGTGGMPSTNTFRNFRAD